MSIELPELYTVGDLQRAYGLSKDTLYDWLKSGELPGFKLGLVWHVRPEDWTAFLLRRRDQTAALLADEEVVTAIGAGRGDAPSSPAPKRSRRVS
jgi:hypothetical protein